MSGSGAGGDEEFALAVAAHERGDIMEAAQRLEAMVRREPRNAQALFKLAQIAFEGRYFSEAVELLSRVVRLAPEVPSYQYHLGLALLMADRPMEALGCFQQTTRLEPDNGAAWLKIGRIQDAFDHREEAAEAFQRAFLTRPGLPGLADNPNIPEPLRQEVRQARQVLAVTYQAQVDEAMQSLQSRYGSDELKRLDLAFRMLTGRAEKQFNHPLQNPEMLLFPDDQARPWFEREEFDWVGRVEAAWPEILEEYTKLRSGAVDFHPYIAPVLDRADEGYRRNATTPAGTDFSSLAGSRDWSAFHLNKSGWNEANCAQCPHTAEVMRATPLAEADEYMPEVFFSVLQPDTHIVPHYGQTNIRLTVHLALDIPDGCGIRVGEETRHWEPGQVLAFDDSFEHEAWNRGDRERGVLIFEVWNPALSEPEREGLQAYYRLRAAWLAKCRA
jgi:aspartate beta-hydroxylase